MRFLDALLSDLSLYRHLRGGKWEREAACCVCPVEIWVRVDVWRSRHWPSIVAREDYR